MINNRGYIYTIITLLIALLLLSLITFYLESSKAKTTDVITKINTDEVHYFVESVKNDLQRSALISGKRAAVYAVNDIIKHEQGLKDYSMKECNGFSYPDKGSQAAICELMLCGTLNGETVDFMENNTLLNWTDRIESNKEFEVEIGITNIDIAPYDAWNFAVIALANISVERSDISSYYGEFSTVSVVPITGLEDPLYLLQTNETDLIPYFKKCDESQIVNGTVINEWINSKCYHSSNSSYNGSGFFDRLDGNLNLSERYLNQSRLYFNTTEIGLESFSDLYEFWNHNIDVNFEKNWTWVDYLYWQNSTGICCVNGTRKYVIDDKNYTFRIDKSHKEKYKIQGADCSGECDVTLI